MATVMACGPLVGTPVVNREDRPMGSLAHVMLDLATGRIASAVIGHGGVLGLGEKHFTVPWEALSFDAARECFILAKEFDTDPALRTYPSTLP